MAMGVRHRQRKLAALRFPVAGVALYVSRQFAIALAIVMAPYVDSPRRVSHLSRISALARKSQSICAGAPGTVKKGKFTYATGWQRRFWGFGEVWEPIS